VLLRARQQLERPKITSSPHGKKTNLEPRRTGTQFLQQAAKDLPISYSNKAMQTRINRKENDPGQSGRNGDTHSPDRIKITPGNRSADRTGRSTGAAKIREALVEDYAQIAALQAEHDFPTTSYEEWVHLWIHNPAYNQFEEKLPIGWVLERDDRQVVGYLGNIPLFYEFNGQRLLACVAHSWVVDKRYRSYSLVLLDRYFSQKSVDLFLNATVGPAAAEPFAVFKSLPVPVGAWDHSAFWITNCQGFTARWLAMKGIPFSTPLGYLLSMIPFVNQTFVKRAPNGDSKKLALHHCTLIDNRFDIFWAELKHAHPNVLLGVRSREALEWHFQLALSRNKAWLVTASKGTAIIAYAIFFRHDNEVLRLKRMRLVDFQSLVGDAALLVPMLAWAVDRCRREGIDMLESIGFSSDKGKLIDKIAPYKRKLPSWLYFYKAGDKSLAERLSNPSAWDPSQFDGDASL